MRKLSFFSRFALLPLLLLAMVASSTMLAQSNPFRSRNLNFGVSGGNVNDRTNRFCCSGTLGSLLQDSQGTQYILSNNHVMGLSGQATAGQDISQPGMIDANCQVTTVVADFTTAPALNTGVDAAIAQLRAGQMNSNGAIEGIGTISSVVKAPAIGLAVQKSGRTTGHTTGTISSISTTVSVRYPKSCGGGGGTTFTFPNQVVINSSTFSAGGDSGSLIVSTGSCPQPVALLFAGSSTSTIGNPIAVVLSRLNAALGRTLSFVGGTCSALTSDDEELPGLSRAAVSHAIGVKERNENRIMSRAAVIGMGVGASDDGTEPVLVVYVDETASVRARLPRRIDGVRVKRVLTDPIVAY
jgi:hypothetical protein